MLVEHRLAQLGRDHVDQLLAVQETRHGVGLEHVRRARQAEGGAGDGDGLRAGRRFSAHDLAAPLQHVHECAAELGVGAIAHVPGSRRLALRGGCRQCNRKRNGCSRTRGKRHGRGFGTHLERSWADAPSVQARQRVVHAGDVAELRVIGGQRQHVGAVAEHVVGEAVERALRAELHEHASTLGVESSSPLTNCTGSATWRAKSSSILGMASAPLG